MYEVLPMNAKQKVMLIILDGLGAAPKSNGNAVVLADPKNLSTFWNVSPHTYLLASGEAVGLPRNVKGNSEVGHLNMGAGRVVSQNLPRINSAIQKGQIYKNNTLRDAFIHATKFNSNIHLVGLLSNGAVHSHIDHFKAIIDYFAKANFANNLYIHAFTDGRDTPVDVALTYLTEIDKFCVQRGIGKIGTIIGRYYAMDRNEKWDRTQRTYYLLTQNVGEHFKTYQEAIQAYYSQGLTDEFIEPAVINESKIKANDVVIFLNYRPDRMIQLAEPFLSDNFRQFTVNKIPNLFVASMVEYRKNFPPRVIFPKQYINLPLGKVIESVGLSQLRVAETEKFPHVTYFFNGGLPIVYDKEDTVLIPSPRVPTYDMKPEMSAFEVTQAILKYLPENIYDFILVNFANTDMVGHTGNLQAGIQSVKVVDECVKVLTREFTLRGGAVLITADHGNVEEMINLETNEIDTEHSLNPVPLIIAGTKISVRHLPYGSLSDIAPTILSIMGIVKPAEMTGNSLIEGI